MNFYQEVKISQNPKFLKKSKKTEKVSKIQIEQV